MKYGKGLLACMLCLLLLTGCGDLFGMTIFTTTRGGGEGENVPVQEEDAPSEPGAKPEPAPEPEPEPEGPSAEEAFLESLAGSYLFCSGAGAWGTELELLPDGSFTGMYHDSDMGDGDPEKYPQGTVYLCQFSGRFIQPRQVDETTWSLTVDSLTLDHPADHGEEFSDGIRYIYSEPYGVEGTETMTVYLPDTPVEGLSEDTLWAARGPYDWQPTEEGTLGLTILYNEPQGHGFVLYPLPEEGT